MAENPVFLAHQQWIGLLQPDGLVVSATALTESDIPLPSDASTLANLQAEFEEVLFKTEDEFGDPTSILLPFEIVADKFLNWPAESFAWAHGNQKVPDSLSVHIPAFQVTLAPTHVLYDADNKPLILIQQVEGSPDLTSRTSRDSSDWDASYVQRMDRLLRDTQVQIGIVASDSEIRLIYAPKSENSGHIGFPISAMRGVEGRKVVAAMYMLLSYDCVLAQYTLPQHRLLALLEKSREAQNKVSAELAEQVLGSLYELIKGIQTADQDARGKLLGKYLREHPEEVYHGLLTVLMRLIFLLFAEDKGIMPAGTLWSRNYSVHGLFERLRDDAQLHGANMDKRYGAWGQLLTTFNLVYNGCAHPQMKMPARLGYLFNSDKYTFLSRDDEGRMPLVSDAIVFSVLRSLLVLGGERISYRALSVENIGVVYETMMGFSVYQANGSCVVLKGAQAPAACELDELIALEGAKRITFIEELTAWKPNAKAAAAIKSAKGQDEMLDALVDRIRHDITPRPLTRGGLTLQPGEERRKSGSHYTPPQLTRPLVAKAFEPHFKRMGDKPDPDAVLSITICDPAMGSGAFLVEATRQLSDKLLEAWAAHPDKDPCKQSGAEDRTFMAMRMVAQRCIYGVDRNSAAVDLAKMSMWLLTISKDHPFTFMDHSLRHGDALVGMSKEQIRRFHWDVSKGGDIIQTLANLDQDLKDAIDTRRELRNLDSDRTSELEDKLAEADEKMRKAKLAGDLLVYAWFSNDKDKTRNEARDRIAVQLEDVMQSASKERKAINALRYANKALVPFHWELEFPEVFADGGFAVFVGNPPFAGKNTAAAGNIDFYLDYLAQVVTPGSSGISDMVAHFFTRPFNFLKRNGYTGPGTMCFISTKTIRQGNTRASSLLLIRKAGGEIYFAQRRVAWPGKAAVIISIVAISRTIIAQNLILDGKKVKLISSFLIDADVDETPKPLRLNLGRSFQGSIVLGTGFTFDDYNPSATPIVKMNEILQKSIKSRPYIKIYVGGEQVNNQPEFSAQRYVIDFGEMPKEQAETYKELWSILEEKVKPERSKLDPIKYRRRAIEWWKHSSTNPQMYEAIKGHSRVLVANCAAAKFLTFSFLPNGMIYSNKLYVFADESYSHFAVLQSRVHEIWARLFGGSLGDQLCYTGTSCYENFPFPQYNTKLEEVGKLYENSRSKVMSKLNLGLTPLGNRLNSSDDSFEIKNLRDLHADMDKTVIEAYGWADVKLEYRLVGDHTNDDGTDGDPRWEFTEEIRDEILRRLLALHAERLKTEQSLPPTSDKKSSKSKKLKQFDGPDLFNS
jgi:N-6 DNA Methylase